MIVIQAQIAAAMDMTAALRQVDGLAWENRELERLIQPEYQERLAQGVARGIEAYLTTLPSKAR